MNSKRSICSITMADVTKEKLKDLYDRAVTLSKSVKLSVESISKGFGLSQYAASCIFYMLQVEEYCPELEDTYQQDEYPLLKGKNENDFKIIGFNEDMPPFRKNQSCTTEDVSQADMQRYVSIGFARWISFGDFLLNRIHIFVSLTRILNQQNANMREAIAHKDKGFYEEYFKDMSKDEILKSLKRDEFNDTEIQSVLSLLSLK